MPVPKGFKHSAETRAKIAAASKARWDDPEYRAKALAGLDKGRNKPTPKRRAAWDNSLEKARTALEAKEATGEVKRGWKGGPQHWNPKLNLPPKSRHHKHGVTSEDYERMLREQGGGCAICERTEPGHGHAHFQVDHDHTCCSGNSCGNCVRGLLCGWCNRMLGLGFDDPETLLRGSRYLQWHKAAQR